MNPKRQRFCEEYAVDLNGAAAATRAGYAPGSAKVTASRLLTDANVRERVDQLIAEGRERLNIDLDSLTEMFVEDRKLARESKQLGAAVSATEKIAKIHGYLKERIAVDVNITTGQMSGAELAAELDEIERESVRREGRPWVEAKIAKFKCYLVEIDSGEFDDRAPQQVAGTPGNPLPATFLTGPTSRNVLP